MQRGTAPPTDLVDAAAAARVARMATTAPGGRVDLVPVTFALIGHGADTRLVTAVDHKPKTTRRLRRLDHIRGHPTVSLLIDHYDDTRWDRLWWVRLTGTAVVVDTDDPAADEAIDALVAKYPQYRQVRPAGPTIVVAPTTWGWWSASGPAHGPDRPHTHEEQP